MKVIFNKREIYSYYCLDKESDMGDVYYIFKNHFGNGEWFFEGNSFDELADKLKLLMQKYPMDIILNRFINSGLAKLVE